MTLCKSVRFKGVVVSGVGRGSYYVRLYRDLFKKCLNIDPYPGTLNIDLGLDASFLWNSFKPYVIKPLRKELSLVYVLPACVNNVRGFIVRSLKTVHGWNIVEVIAEYCLREMLKLKDGDVIEVVVYSGECISNYTR